MGGKSILIQKDVTGSKRKFRLFVFFNTRALENGSIFLSLPLNINFTLN